MSLESFSAPLDSNKTSREQADLRASFRKRAQDLASVPGINVTLANAYRLYASGGSRADVEYLLEGTDVSYSVLVQSIAKAETDDSR